MADKQISSLPAATSVDDGSLFVVEQQGAAMSASGALWKGFAVQAVQPYITSAQSSAAQAAESATQAQQAAASVGSSVTAAQEAQQAAESAANNAQTAQENAEKSASAASTSAANAAQSASTAQSAEASVQQNAEKAESSASAAEKSASDAQTSAQGAQASATAAANSAQSAAESAESISGSVEQAASSASAAAQSATQAEAARQAIENMGVEAQTLPPGQDVSITKQTAEGIVNLLFGIPTGETGPQGEQGEQGVGIQSFEQTGGTHAPGTLDTYTLTLTNGQSYQIQIYNGANGTGSGDFMADGTVPMSGALQMGGNSIVNIGEAVNDTDAVNLAQVKALIESAKNEILGMNFFVVQPGEGE